MRWTNRLIFRLSPLLLLVACAGPIMPGSLDGLLKSGNERVRPSAPPLAKLGYSVQIGAFSVPQNAVRLEESLRRQGIDAYYFRHQSGLYKVRLGDHPTYAAAREEAETLQERGVIGDFFIVRPQDYPAAQIVRGRPENLRRELVATARRFLGVPYCWGGESAKSGFDCSGLTMVTYRLNGLKLPRNSRLQFAVGTPVPRSELRRGDLVFFATSGGRRVSHVGIYIGNGKFIHAPRQGKNVRIASLSSRYFSKTYVGGRTYL